MCVYLLFRGYAVLYGIIVPVFEAHGTQCVYISYSEATLYCMVYSTCLRGTRHTELHVSPLSPVASPPVGMGIKNSLITSESMVKLVLYRSIIHTLYTQVKINTPVRTHATLFGKRTRNSSSFTTITRCRL